MPIRLMICDDHEVIRTGLASLLAGPEIEIVAEAANGKDALKLAVKDKPDIILLDIQLPVMDGYSALLKIREFSKDVIIIAQTAYGLLGDKEKILNSGFNDYVIKPILAQNLIDKLVANLSKR